MGEPGTGHESYEDWSAVMETLLHGEPAAQQVAFLKLQRLIAGFLVALQVWDYREQVRRCVR